MTYEDLRSMAGLTGLAIFIALFVVVLIYAFWPGNKKHFERARHIPLDEDPEIPPERIDPHAPLDNERKQTISPRGENGR